MKLYRSYLSEKSSLAVNGEVVEIKAFQIIVWVSISELMEPAWDPRLPRIPAILDTGTTHNFALTETHLHRWAGFRPSSLRRIGKVRIGERTGDRLSAALWLHNDASPFALNTDGGIAILAGDWPRLPILGLRALTNSRLQTFIYGNTKKVLIRTPPQWYWPF